MRSCRVKLEERRAPGCFSLGKSRAGKTGGLKRLTSMALSRGKQWLSESFRLVKTQMYGPHPVGLG